MSRGRDKTLDELFAIEAAEATKRAETFEAWRFGAATVARWPLVPRVLTKAQAAAYCGQDEAGFEHWVAKGKLPDALREMRRWDRVAIDIALDRLSGIDRSKPSIETPDEIFARWKVERAARDAAKAARPDEPPITKRRGRNRERS